MNYLLCKEILPLFPHIFLIKNDKTCGSVSSAIPDPTMLNRRNSYGSSPYFTEQLFSHLQIWSSKFNSEFCSADLDSITRKLRTAFLANLNMSFVGNIILTKEELLFNNLKFTFF